MLDLVKHKILMKSEQTLGEATVLKDHPNENGKDI